MEHEPGTGSILRLQFFVNPTRTELLLLWLYTMLLKTNPYRVEKQIMKFCIPKRIRHGFDYCNIKPMSENGTRYGFDFPILFQISNPFRVALSISNYISNHYYSRY